ncbi:MAG TPA: PAS domain-containing protein [Acidimicrobiales bacterium]|nr:PAS domain-containing protein [Acidimicrobiales bacterium]
MSALLDERALSGLLDDLPDAVVVVDSEGKVIWGNRTAERLFGRPLDSAIGASGLELVHPDDLELALLSLVSVQGKELGAPIEVRIATASGWRLAER